MILFIILLFLISISGLFKAYVYYKDAIEYNYKRDYILSWCIGVPSILLFLSTYITICLYFINKL